MNSLLIEKYIDHIYKYALSKTFSEDEAECLASEILFHAVASLPKLRDETRFEPWLWSLAANTARAFRRTQSKERTFFLCNVPDHLLENQKADVLDTDGEEVFAVLREKIAMMSKIYREIIILYYYDGLSIKEISGQLNLSPGTVAWRLSIARNKLKKEFSSMEESALHPVKIHIEIYGSANYNKRANHGKYFSWPGEKICDALSQNILFYCYKTPKTAEELAKLTGVPAYYVEDKLDSLDTYAALIQPSKGRYQTDFIIITEAYWKFCMGFAKENFRSIADQMCSALEKLFEEAEKINFYRGGKSSEELKYLYGILAFWYLNSKYNTIPEPEIPVNYDGYKWRFLGATNEEYSKIAAGMQLCVFESRFSHRVYFLEGFKYRPSMSYDDFKICREIYTEGKTCADKSTVAELIQVGFISRRRNGELFLSVPVFSFE